MILTRVKLLSFRNLEKVELDVSPQINIFLGRNGQGKTNLLEGLGYLALGRSHRGSRDREMIRFGDEGFHVAVEGEDGSGDPFRLEASVTRTGTKRIKINGDVAPRGAELLGRLSTVVFNPHEVDLTRGAPDFRRRFLDYTLSIASTDYFRDLLAYRRALAQKNRLLKERFGAIDDQLDAWDAELVRYGTPLLRARAAVLPALEEAASRAYAEFDPSGELRLQLRGSIEGQDEEDGELQERFRAALAKQRGRERAMGFALVGPHRDRLEVLLSGRSIRHYGSQGEMRSAAIALKLGQAEMIFERTRERPVVMLDDIFSELDRGRTHALQERLRREHQLFIATARVDDVRGMDGWSGLSAWLVREGKVSPLEHLEPGELDDEELGSMGGRA